MNPLRESPKTGTVGATQITKQIMFAEETPAWRLSAKTGAYHPVGEDTANWYVGYVEKGGDVYCCGP